MIDRLRTLSARFFTRYNIGPRELRIRAWAWLAAEANEPAKKVRCLEAILAIDQSVEWAQVALRNMQSQIVRMN